MPFVHLFVLNRKYEFEHGLDISIVKEILAIELKVGIENILLLSMDGVPAKQKIESDLKLIILIKKCTAH